MAIASAGVTAGQTYSAGNTVTATNLNLLGVPTVKLAPTGDLTTGISSPVASALGIEAGGTEIVRFSTSGIAARYQICRDIDTSVLSLYGGTTSSGANIELYGSTHSTLANDIRVDADEVVFRNQNQASTYMSVSGSGFKVGSTGSAVKAIWHTTQALDIAPAAGEEAVIGTKTVTGAAAGDIVLLSQSANSDYIVWQGYVSAANTVSYSYFYPLSTGSAAFTGNLLITVLDIT